MENVILDIFKNCGEHPRLMAFSIPREFLVKPLIRSICELTREIEPDILSLFGFNSNYKQLPHKSFPYLRNNHSIIITRNKTDIRLMYESDFIFDFIGTIYENDELSAQFQITKFRNFNSIQPFYHSFILGSVVSITI